MAQQTTTVNPVLSQILERGYWRSVIRPLRFEQERIGDIRRLYPLVAERAVRFKSWDYPFSGSADTLRVANDWVEQSLVWNHHRDYWRFYQSGQFVHYRALAEDWGVIADRWATQTGGPPGALVPVYDTLYRFTEIFEFAARLAISEEYNAGSHLHVAVLVKNLNNRELYNDASVVGRRLLLSSKPAQAESYEHSLDLPVSELIAAPRSLALREAERLFRLFHWQPGLDLLQHMQEEFAQT